MGCKPWRYALVVPVARVDRSTTSDQPLMFHPPSNRLRTRLTRLHTNHRVPIDVAPRQAYDSSVDTNRTEGGSMASLNISDYDRDPVQAIQEYWMNAADEGFEVTPDMIAEAVVDAHCSRGDYEGCSSDLELDYCEAFAAAERAL